MTDTYSTYTNSKSHWKEFLKAIDRFTVITSKTLKLPDLYREGLTVFSRLPDAELSALYMLSDDNTPDFELKLALPAGSESYFEKLFETLINEGRIGISLASGNIINVDESYLPDKDFGVLIIPIKKHRGINGLALVVHKSLDENLNQFLIELCRVYASLLGNSIENFNMLNELEFNKSILEQKIATRTLDLAQSRRELKAIFESVLTGVIVFDLSISKIVRVNPVAAAIIGLQDSLIVGKNVFDFLEYIDYGEIAEANGVSNFKSFESELKLPNGKIIPILRNTTKLRLNNRILITESFVDIAKIKEAEQALTKTNELLELKVQERTEDLQLLVHKLKQEIADREKAESELRLLYEQQKELSNLKTRFVTMVSHEFRTPLTIIKSSAQMISKFKEKLTDADKFNYVNRVTKSVDYLTDLIDNVVFIGKSDANKFFLNYSAFDIVKLINDVVLDYKINYNQNRNFVISSSLQDNILYSDEKIMHMILSNLISNAVKYSEPDTDIVINLDIRDGLLELSIQDFGIGIPESEQNRIFELFYRADNSTPGGGTGIGLAVVKESVVKLGGRIELQSKVGIGSEFKVILPIRIK
ncbi:MAG: PAS domain-containing sensor histidine kinase [Candidatus Kapabacteria bacterium]|nr:PAS domain-containing sensor histidine kinase [Ignavibacteriota bacterium]MCW5885737.1 PAS domain-containing sensor histidine kinase [Candidatus Kapabacteria bacterium]